MECKCETCVKKDCPDRTNQDSLRMVIACVDYTEQEHKPTKADRIRAMTDEELADWISNFVYEIGSGEVAYSDDTDQWLFWLQQPAEGEST